MAQEDVADLLHEGGFGPGWTMVRVQDHEFHAVGQRAGAAGPRFACWSKKVLARGVAETLDFFEVEDDQVCKAREVKGVERQVRAGAGEVAQGHGFEFEVSPLFTWRE